MRSDLRRRLVMLAALLLVAPAALFAAGQAIVLHQNLSEMTAEANRIYRGTVQAVEEGSVDLAGTTLPATTYRIAVSELFKGDVDQQKGDLRAVELKIVGTSKSILRMEGDLAVMSVLPAPPALVIGDDYLFFTNAPNAYGLANTIGLGQGYFHITGVGKAELAANELDNLGLFKGMGEGFPAKGAVSYDALAELIRAELGQ